MKKKLVLAIVGGVAAVTCVSLLTVGLVGNGVSKKDKTYIDNLNNILLEEKVEDKSFHDILTILKGKEYDVPTYSLSKGSQTLCWNQKDNQFIVLNKFGGVIYPKGADYSERNDLWVFADEEKDLSSDFSTYLVDGFKEDGDHKLSVDNGVDVGNNTSITTIDYDNDSNDEVIINGGNANINVKSNVATLTYYGVCSNFILSSEVNTLNIRGNANFVDFNSGNLNIYGSVKGVYLNKAFDENQEVLSASLHVYEGATLTNLGIETGAIFDKENSKSPVPNEITKEEFVGLLK